MATFDSRCPVRSALILLLTMATVSCGLWLDDEARLHRARNALENKHFSAAIVDLKYVLRIMPDNVVARRLLGLALLASGDPESAAKEFESALLMGEDLSEFRVALVEAYLATGQVESALQIADPKSATNAGEAFLLWLYRGDAQAQMSRTIDALRSFDQAASLGVDRVTAFLRKADTYWNAGRLADAMIFAEKAVMDDPDRVDASLAVAAIYLDMGDPQSAEDTLRDLSGTTRASPEDSGLIHFYLGEAHLAAGNTAAARQALDRVETYWPDQNPDLQYLAGRIALAEGDNDAAVVELLAFLVEHPESASAMRMLGAAQLRRGMVNQAGQQLSRVLASDPRRVENRVLLARVYLAQRQFIMAQDVLEPILQSTAVDSVGLSLLGLSELLISGDTLSVDSYQQARDQLLAGKVDSSLRTLRAMPGDLRDHPLVLEILGLSYLTEGHFPAAIASFGNAIAADVNNSRFRFNLARAHLANGTFAAGMRIMAVLDPLDPMLDPVQDSGQDPAAVDEIVARAAAIERALLIGWNASKVDLGDPDPSLLLQWLDRQPGDDDVRWMLAETYLQNGQFATAAEQFVLLLAQSPDDPAIHNNLAWSYLQMGDPRARAQAELAYGLAPNEGEVIDTLGWIYASEGDFDKGISLLRDAHLLMPGKPESAYHLAAALSRAGAEDQAIALLQALLARGGGSVKVSATELLAALERTPGATLLSE